MQNNVSLPTCSSSSIQSRWELCFLDQAARIHSHVEPSYLLPVSAQHWSVVPTWEFPCWMWVWKQILACLKSPGICSVAWKIEDGWSVQKVLDLLQPWCSCYLSPSGQELTRKLLLWSDKQRRLVKCINWFSSIKQFWTHSLRSEWDKIWCVYVLCVSLYRMWCKKPKFNF